MICTDDGILWLPKLVCNKKLSWCIKCHLLFIYIALRQVIFHCNLEINIKTKIEIAIHFSVHLLEFDCDYQGGLFSIILGDKCM